MSHAFLWFLSTIAARTAIVALFLLGGLRLLGKRQIGQLNIYDLAMVMALANAVQNAMTNGNGNLSVGIVSAGTLLLLGFVFTLIFVRLPRLEQHVVGTPTLLVSDGKMLPERMKREHVTDEQIFATMRQHGLSDIGDVLMATLEVDGTISIVPRTADHHRTRKRIRRAGRTGATG
jgi:uncharacterized membrane protein YcaP (DUF421 family)